jgi:hypothetical protein
MRKKTIISTEEEKNIINQYVNTTIGIEKIAKQYKVGELPTHTT